MKKNKKNLMVSGLIIVLAGCGVIAGTTAYFSAKKTISQSNFIAGTLDLDVNSNGESLQPFIINNVGENADMKGNKVWKIKNTGTLPGRLIVQLQNVSNKENGCNTQEKETEPNCENDDQGELGKAINLNISLNNEKKVSGNLTNEGVQKIATDWANLPQIALKPGEEVNLEADWSASENDYGNEVQSDSVNFDMDFRLVQQTASDSSQ